MKYRVVRDKCNGFEVQSWRWYWPFWMQCHNAPYRTNRHHTLDEALIFIEKCKKGKKIQKDNEVVWRG